MTAKNGALLNLLNFTWEFFFYGPDAEPSTPRYPEQKMDALSR